MGKVFDPLIAVDLGDEMETQQISIVWQLSKTKQITFNNPEAFSAFIAHERNMWKTLFSVRDDSTQHVLSQIVNTHQLVLSALDKLRAQWSASEDLAKEIEDSLNHFTSSINYPFAITPEGSYIHDVASREPVFALVMAYIQMAPHEDGRISQTELIKPIFTLYDAFTNEKNAKVAQCVQRIEPYKLRAIRALATFDVIGTDDAVQTYLNRQAKHEEALTEYDKRAESHLRKLDAAIVKTIKGQKTRIKEEEHRGHTLGRKLLKSAIRKKRLAERILKKAHKDVVNAQNAFRAQIDFDETSKYWAEKEGNHKLALASWFIWLIGAVSATVLLPIIVNLIPDTCLPRAPLLMGTFHPLKLMATILIISLGSFVIRFAARQYSSHQHLALEAAERQTMLKTYIGLMENGKLDEHEDRKIALNTMFKPAQTGIVADYSVSPAESVIRIVEKGVVSRTPPPP